MPRVIYPTTITIQTNIRLLRLDRTQAQQSLVNHLGIKLIQHARDECVKCEAVPVSGCGVGDYSSVMRWMVVVVCVRHDVIV